MIAAVTNLSDAVTHYDLHRLRANVQFSDTEKLCGQRKQIYPSFIGSRPQTKSFSDDISGDTG